MGGDPDYYLDNYGKCQSLEEKRGCLCAKYLFEGKLPWQGRNCPMWRPLGVTTLEQLEQYIMGTRNE